MARRLAVTSMCAAIALLAGCNRSSPQGQVAAVVNGDEVTVQELNAEVQGQNIPQGADKQEVQRNVLQRVIDRKLLIGTAKEKGLDKNAEYLSAKRRADELLLAQSYARQQLAAVPLPTDAEVNKFMADHPNVFGGREQLTVDQIRFAPPKDMQLLRQLNGDHSMDAVAAHLTRMGIKFSRGPAGLDSAAAPPALMKLIADQPSEPFVVPDRGMVTISVVTGRKAAPTDPQQAKAAAVQAWRQQKFDDLLRQQLATLRTSAKITYQNGFSPPAAGQPGAPGTPAAGAAPATAAKAP